MKIRFFAAIAVVCLLTFAHAQKPTEAKPLATAELDVPGVVAEVIESTRRGDVLTVRVRFRNTGAEPATIALATAGQYGSNYISAGDTKYEVMRDARHYVVASPMDPGGYLGANIRKGGTWNWWAKFPAPPSEIKTYTLYLKVGPPIEDVPILEKESAASAK